MNDYLTSVGKQFRYYKSLGDKAFEQVEEAQLFESIGTESNSIAVIVNHMVGNMRSRWTDFLTTDGEKTWRNRDREFEDVIDSKPLLLNEWEDGWRILFEAIDPLTNEDLQRLIYIRNMGHTVTEAINRQLAHYAYHVGQIVFLAKALAGENWTSLSISKGKSSEYNQEKFAKPKRKEHFTDDL